MGYLLDLEEDIAGLATDIDKYQRIIRDQKKQINKLTVENKLLKAKITNLNLKSDISSLKAGK